MIRMGRGNRPETTSSPEYKEQAQPEAYRYSAETQAAPARAAVTESDSMARDIKEGRLSGFVGHGTTLTGETNFHAMLRVDGHLVGSVTSDSGTLIIGSSGQVDANIHVAAAMINGTVNGDVFVKEKLQLGRTARVLGNIQSPRLIVEEGAILEGSCNMLKAIEVREEEAAAATASAATQYQQASQPTIGSLDESGPLGYLSADEEEDEEESPDAAAV